MSPKNSFRTVPMNEVPLPQSALSHTSHRPSILVVDDESNIADTLSEILNRSGYSAHATYDAESALDFAMLTPPEMIITDVVLPDMNGIDLAITVHRIFPECKILLFSGQASTADLLTAAKSKGHHFALLEKPVHPVDLLARLSGEFKAARAVAVGAR